MNCRNLVRVEIWLYSAMGRGKNMKVASGGSILINWRGKSV
jgi:hypothetical protein